MAFPTTLDDGTSLPTPSASNATNSPSHAGLHGSVNTAVIAVETKLGIGASTPVVSRLLFGTGTGTSAWTQLTSAQLAATLSDETGTGSAVFATTPTLVTPKVDTINESTPANGVTVAGVNMKSNAISTSNSVPTAALQDSSVTSAKVAAGMPVQIVATSFGTMTTGSTIIPFDNTIPQITEGDQYMTQAITPKSATNILIIETIFFGTSSIAAELIMALFQDATANALAASSTFHATADARRIMPLAYNMVAGTTSSTTFRIRVGSSGASTTTFNGSGGSAFYGATSKSILKITEVKA